MQVLAVYLIIGILIAISNSAKKKKAAAKETALREKLGQKAAAQPSAPRTPARQSGPRASGSLREGDEQPDHRHRNSDAPLPVSGSLNYESSEGMDPDHEHSMHLSDLPDADSGSAVPGLRLRFGTDELLNAFVLQEILTRPEQRQSPMI